MPDQARVVVTNTTPLIALTAATGNLDVLRTLYTRVIVPYEVAEEIRAGGKDAFGLDVFDQASWLEINSAPVVLLPYLQNTLDRGEASVIQTALQQGIKLVCIDEMVGRRIARLSNLSVTGSIGVLLKAKSMGYALSIPEAINRMRDRGIWLSQDVIHFALERSDSRDNV
jgi:predicted nucleic acid-binding protein